MQLYYLWMSSGEFFLFILFAVYSDGEYNFNRDFYWKQISFVRMQRTWEKEGAQKEKLKRIEIRYIAKFLWLKSHTLNSKPSSYAPYAPLPFTVHIMYYDKY